MGMSNPGAIVLGHWANLRQANDAARSLEAASGGNWLLDGAAKRLHSPDGRSLDLCRDDVVVLRCLLAHHGAVCDRNELLAHLGDGYRHQTDARFNALLCRLRQKLVNFDYSLRIHSWRSRGYAFVGPAVRTAEDSGGKAPASGRDRAATR